MINKTNVQVHALHKSGTMFLYKFFQVVASHLKYNYYSENNTPNNYNEYSSTENNVIICPVRNFTEVASGVKNIIQVRNPLDILVSQYFSFGFTHSKAKKDDESFDKYQNFIKNTNINDYSIWASTDLLARYSELINYPQGIKNNKYISYFNMVYDFEFWMKDILSFMEVKDQTLETLLMEKFSGEFENFKAISNKEILEGNYKHHKRSIYSGDFAQQLKGTVVQVLSEKFRKVIDLNNNLKCKSALLNYEKKSFERITLLSENAGSKGEKPTVAAKASPAKAKPQTPPKVVEKKPTVKKEIAPTVYIQSSTSKTHKKIRPMQTKNRPKVDRHLRMADEVSKFSGSFAGLKVLDIGGDSQGLLAKAVVTLNPDIEEITVINPVIKETKQEGKVILKNGDSRKLDYPDNHFDKIISFAAFEHFFNFDVALNELYRVLKPNGTLFSKFGPLWSSQLGHHLWQKYEGQLYTFQNTVLPAYCHLIYERPKFQAWAENRFGNKVLANRITNYVYSCKDQNRLFFSDYEKIVNESKFQKLFFMGHLEYPINSTGLEGESYQSLLQKVKKKFPDKEGFGYVTISTLLSKS